MRLRNLFRGKHTFREIHSYLIGLPQESLTQTAIRDDPNRMPVEGESDQFGPWSLTDYLLAAVVDAVRINSHYFVMAHSDPSKGAPPKAPDLVPRPGASKTKKKPRLSAEQRAYLDSLRPKKKR